MVDYDNFAESFGRSRKGLHWEDIDILVQKSLSFLPSPWDILDLGCGNGRLLEHLNTSLIKNYTGVDISRVLLSQAGARFPEKNWVTGDMRSLQDIQLSCVNICFFIASFHHLTHLDERISVLRYIQNQVLATDGLLVFTNWNLLSPYNSPYTSSCVEKYPDGSADFFIKIGKYHRFYHAFSPQEYEKIAQELRMSIRFVSFGERNSLLILQ